MPVSIHKVLSFPCYTLLFLCFMLLSLVSLAGCSAKGQSVEALFTAADSQLYKAQESGAGQLASAEFEEAKSLYTEAEIALERKDNKAYSLIQKASAKARLAEVLARRANADAELAKAEKELEEASVEATRSHAERIAAEGELDQMSPKQ